MDLFCTWRMAYGPRAIKSHNLLLIVRYAAVGFHMSHHHRTYRILIRWQGHSGLAIFNQVKPHRTVFRGLSLIKFSVPIWKQKIKNSDHKWQTAKCNSTEMAECRWISSMALDQVQYGKYIYMYVQRCIPTAYTDVYIHSRLLNLPNIQPNPTDKFWNENGSASGVRQCRIEEHSLTHSLFLFHSVTYKMANSLMSILIWVQSVAPVPLCWYVLKFHTNLPLPHRPHPIFGSLAPSTTCLTLW